jgi:putative hydrolase of the HAD superfamily
MDRPVRKAQARKRKLERSPNREPRENSAVHAVTFDVGGTLIECRPSVGHIYAQVAARHRHIISPAVLNRRFKAAWRGFKGFRHTRADWSDLVDETFRGLVEPLPSESFFSELYARFSEPDAWHVYQDVIPTLENLKSHGLKLGIISNWDDRLRPLLRILKLDRYFDTIVVSCEAGACKPAARIFTRACAGLDVSAGNTLHIGDDLETDLRGAKAAGLQALHLRREARRVRTGEIVSLGDLISYDNFYYVLR